MLNFLLTFAETALIGVSVLFQKMWQLETQYIKNASYAFLAVMTFFSIIVFYFTSGFDVRINPTTLIYSLIYSAIAIISVILLFAAMSRINLILYSVLNNSQSLLVWIYGIIFMKEQLYAGSIISAVLFSISIIIPIFDIKKNKTNVLGYVIGIAVALNSSASSILLKYYAASPSKMSDSTLCFYTNVFMLALILIWFLISHNSRPSFKQLRTKKKAFMFIFFCTLCNNFSSILQLYILKTMPISLYSILIAALGCIVTFIISKLIFKEQCYRRDILSLILSTAATIIAII